MARTEALRKLKLSGYEINKEQARRLGVLMSVVEDQQRGLPHEHVVCPHTSALEIAFTWAFFDALPRAARHHQLGIVDRYRFAVGKQGRYHAGEFHGYLAKLARYLAKSASAGAFLRQHHGERERLVGPLVAAPAAVGHRRTGAQARTGAAKEPMAALDRTLAP